MTPGPTYRLHVFGPMRLESAERSLAITGPNTQRLVGYLALHPRVAHRREALVDVLWPDASPAAARRTLSDTLYRLRTRTGAGFLEADGDSVALAGGVGLWVDVWEFDRLADGTTRADLEAAIALHTADMLPGVYDDWALSHRVARRAALLEALGQLVAADELVGDLQRALTQARQMILLEPFHEPAHQTYLRLLGRLRRHGEAAAHLEQLNELFIAELGVAPLAETTRLVEHMLDERTAVVDVDERTAFVGRAAERGKALRSVEAACNGCGSILAIEGEAGIGKTRLLGEVVRGAQWRGAVVLVGDARDVPEAAPLAPLARAVSPALAGASLAQIESSLDPTRRMILGQLHSPWGGAAVDGAFSGNTEQAAARLANGLRAFGRALAGVGPVVLALDDMHWASADLWEALAALVDGLVREGGLVVVAYRRPDIESTDGWGHLQAWDRAGMVTAISLTPFGKDDVAALMSTADGDPDEVLAITGGVPFWVTQWLTGTTTERGGDRVGMIRRRLDVLSPLQHAALECAAVLGERVPFGVWTAVVECSPIELAEAGEQLAQGRWLTPSPAGYTFTHDLIRAAVYEQIPPPRRKSLHARAAEAVARREPDNLRTRAYHLDLAGRDVEASAMYRRAGEQYLATSAVREAVEAFARAFELQPDTAVTSRLELGLALAKACESVNDYERQRPALAVVTTLARALGDNEALLRALLIAGLAASRSGDHEASARLLSEALALAGEIGDERGVIDATYLMADLHAQQGQWRAAEAAWSPVLEYARRVGDQSLVGRTLRGLAIAAKQMGDPQSAVRLLEEALDALRRSGDRVNELYTSSNLLGVLYDLEAWDRLLVHADEMWPVAEVFGDPVTVGVIRHQQGLAAMALGDHSTARAMMAAAKDAFAVAERPRMVGLVVNTIGLVAEDEGDLDEAESLYREALRTAEWVDAATESAYARHDLGALFTRTGRSAEAIPLLRAAADAWEEQGNLLLRAKSEAHLGLALLAAGGQTHEAMALADSGLAVARAGAPAGEQPQGWLWALVRLLDRLGRPAEAAEVLGLARAELDRQAQAISDAGMRRQFFDRVPVNRAIVSAHDGRARQTTIAVRLARLDAPLGRTLREDERVLVHWTLHAPGDDAIAGDGARRRHRLMRLLDEAEVAGGAPTDDDLASALGVSRRTILRDIESIATSRPVLRTRRRSRATRT